MAVSGTAEAGATVTVHRGGTLAGTATATGGTFTVVVPVSDGTWSFTAVATDAAGNGSPVSNAISVQVDHSAPAAPTLGGLATPTNALAITVTGAAEPGSAVSLYLDGALVASGVAAGGTFSFAGVPVDEGNRRFTARATDEAGNASPLSAPVSILVDRTPPGVPVLAPLASPTKALSVTVGGTAEAGATVELFLNGVSVGSTVAPGGTFSLSVPVPLGPVSFTAAATDAAGNVSGLSAPVAITVDRTAPGLATVDVPVDGAVLGAAAAPGGAVAFGGTSELGSTVEVEVDGIVLGLAGAPGGTWAATFTLLDGPHRVRVRATDAAGNPGAWSGTSGFGLDAAGPLAPILDALVTPTSAATVTATGVAELDAVVTVYVDGTFAGTVATPSGAFSLALVLAEGLHSVTATATDLGGNVSALSTPVPVEVDWTSPAAPSLDPLATPTSAPTVTVTGTAGAGTASVTILRGGAPIGSATPSGGRFALAVAVSEGSWTFTAIAADAAGNVSGPSNAVTILVDWSAPAAPALDPLATPTNATTVTVAGTTDAATTVTVYRDGAAVGTAVETGGRFSLTVPVGEGTFAFTAIARDGAGNGSAVSDPVSLTVDQTVPAAPTLDPLVTPTSASSVAVSGSADAGASTVTVYRDGIAVGTAAVAGGRFSLAVPVFSGAMAFTAKASDAAGNVSGPSAAVPLVVDHAAPAVPVLDALTSPTRAATATVTGRADAGSVVTLYVGAAAEGTTVAALDGTFSFSVTLVEGATTFTATAADEVGNVSAPSAPVSVVADRIAPDAPLLASLESPTGASTVTVIGSAEPGSTVTISLDGSPVATTVADGSGSFFVDVGVPSGVLTVVATATDAAGNISIDSNAVPLVVDHALPAPPVLAALTSPTNATTVTVTGTAEVGSTVTLYLDGVSVGTFGTSAGTFALMVGVPEGTHAFTARSSNWVGNVSAVSNTVVLEVDRTPPAAPVVETPVAGVQLGAGSAPGGVVGFTGTAEAGTTVEVEVDSITTVVSAGAGSWAGTLALADGPHQVRARAVDALGNVGSWSPASAFTLDTTAPGAPSLDPLATPTNAASVIVTGSAEAGATVTVHRDGASVGTATATGGRFSLAVTVGEGTFAFTATARDVAGNLSPLSSAVTLEIDRTAPAAPVLDPLAAVTNAATVAVTGSAEAGSRVTVKLGATPVASVTATAGGTFSATVPVPEGMDTFTATASDAAGNVSGPSNAVSIRVDCTAPAAPALGSVPAFTNANPVVVAGTAEAGSVVELLVDGVSQGTLAAGPAFSFSLPGLGEGPHTVVAVARDVAGNASAPASAGLEVDRTAPSAASVDAPAEGTLVGAASAPGGTVSVSGSSEPGSTVEVEVDGTPLGSFPASSGAWAVPATLLDGPHQIRVRPTDAAGNAGPWSGATGFVLDTTAPLAPTFDPVAPTSAATVAVTGVADAGANVSVSVDGTFVGTAVAADDGSFSLALPLGEGTHAVTAEAIDAAGNASSASTPAAVVVDRTAPVVPVLGPLPPTTNLATLPVTGTAEPGATVSVLVDGAPAGTGVAAADGTWSVPVPAGAEGSRVVTATVSDPAGNSSGMTAPITVAVDRTPPPAPVLTAPAEGEKLAAGTVTVEGTTEPGATVSVVVDGSTYTDVAGAGGEFSVTVSVPAGAWTATATATDPASNASAPVTVNFTTSGPPVVAAHVTGGGCGCGPGGGTPASALLLLGLALALSPRRRVGGSR